MELSIAGKAAFIATQGRAIEPARASIVLIHAAGVDRTVWTLVARYFIRHGRNVLAVDLPGHGRSEGPPLGTISALADWVAEAIVTAGVARAAVAGHSMGALVALELARRHSTQIEAIALLGASVPMPVAPPLLAAAENNNHAALDMLTIWGHSYAGQVGGLGPPGVRKTVDYLRLLEKAAPGVVYADLKACNDYSADLRWAAQIRCPALLIIGGHDLMTPAQAAGKLAAAMPGARTVLLENCGHAMLTERPNAVLDALAAFFEQPGIGESRQATGKRAPQVPA